MEKEGGCMKKRNVTLSDEIDLLIFYLQMSLEQKRCLLQFAESMVDQEIQPPLPEIARPELDAFWCFYDEHAGVLNYSGNPDLIAVHLPLFLKESEKRGCRLFKLDVEEFLPFSPRRDLMHKNVKSRLTGKVMRCCIFRNFSRKTSPDWYCSTGKDIFPHD